MSLRLGAVSEEVKVTGDAAIVTVTTQDISGLVGEQQVKDLPLNGRSYDLLLTLNPGIVNFTAREDWGDWSIEFHHGKQFLGVWKSAAAKPVSAERRGIYGSGRK